MFKWRTTWRAPENCFTCQRLVKTFMNFSLCFVCRGQTTVECECGELLMPADASLFTHKNKVYFLTAVFLMEKPIKPLSPLSHLSLARGRFSSCGRKPNCDTSGVCDATVFPAHDEILIMSKARLPSVPFWWFPNPNLYNTALCRLPWLSSLQTWHDNVDSIKSR